MLSDINVIIADDNNILRQGLNLVLDQEENIKVIGEAANEIQTISVTAELKPDVLLLGNILVEGDAKDTMEIIPTIRKSSPRTKPILLSGFAEDDKMFDALKAGARGFLFEAATAWDLIRAIKTVHQGEMWVERKLISKYFDRLSVINGSKHSEKRPKLETELTARELDVLRYLTEGRTNKEIACAMFISEKTVKSHLYSIFKKLNVTRRLHATLCAIKMGLK